jgi:glycosyltransferase involved in cell wall biosynthesis
MHILLIHQAFAALQEPGGTRHYELARYLVEKGHQVTVIASPISYLTGEKTHPSPAHPVQQEPEGLTILRAYAYDALHRSFIHRVVNFISFMISALLIGLRVQQVDLVWGTSPPIFQAVSAWIIARIKRIPLIFEVRDLWPAFAVAVGVLRNPLLICLSTWLEKFLYRHADRVMVNSPGFVDHVISKGAVRVSLVPNGADPRMFDPEANGAAFRQAHRLSGKFVILYAGAHGMSNDLGVVLEAAHLLKDRTDIAFVLLGDGKDKTHLMKEASEMQLDNLSFLPPIPKMEIPQALAGADACIAILKPIPLYKTVYPNKVFDYMAAGRPVILAIDGVIREAVEAVQAGIPTPPGDAVALAEAVRRLADQPELGRQMGANGRKYVEQNFDRLILASQLEQILQNLVNS